MLEYDGRNYLFRTLLDYEKKIYNGISLTCYVDENVWNRLRRSYFAPHLLQSFGSTRKTRGWD